MKRKLTSLLCIMMLLSLFGCKSKTHNDDVVVPAIENENIVEDTATEDTTNESKPVKKEEINDSQQIIDTPTQSVVIDSEQNVDNTLQSDVTDVTDSEAERPTIEPNTETIVQRKEIDVNAKPFFDADHITSDSFVATVESVTSLVGEKIKFNNIDEFDKYCLYTVRIEKVYRQTFVDEGTVINYISQLRPDEYYWFDPLEVGKRYLFCGVVQEYNGDPVVVDMGKFTSLIEEDGTLVPSCHAYTLSSFKTLADLEANAEFKEYCQADFENFDVFGYSDLAKQISENNAHKDVDTIEKELAISLIKDKMTVEE